MGRDFPCPFELVEKPLFRRIRPSVGGGARGGGSPPRVGSNALNALRGKAFSERSEDFSAAQRWESIGIFRLSEKSLDFFDSLRTASRQGGGPPFLEEPVQNQIRLSQGGGARGGSRPPRMGSNAPEALLCKASGKRSEDFCAE